MNAQVRQADLQVAQAVFVAQRRRVQGPAVSGSSLVGRSRRYAQDAVELNVEERYGDETDDHFGNEQNQERAPRAVLHGQPCVYESDDTHTRFAGGRSTCSSSSPRDLRAFSAWR